MLLFVFGSLICCWQALLYAMQVMDDEKPLSAYHVPPGCKVLVAVEAAKLGALPDPDSAYWN